MPQAGLPALLGGEPIARVPFETGAGAFGGELEEVARVLSAETWLDGHATRRFEEELAAYVGARHAVAVNTGGMAIQIALRVLGVAPGDEVLMPVDTCVADAFAVFNAGGAPVFADTDPDTFTLDWASAEDAIGPRTRVLLPVHMWGRPADMDAAQRVAHRHGLLLLDDACLAFGAEWRGRKAGTFGSAGVYSFGWMKPLRAGGGGAVVTDDESLARQMRASRAWGDLEAEFGVHDQKELAWNGRMSEILAAVLLAQLRGYPERLARLREHAARLDTLLEGLPGIGPMPQDERITAQARTKYLFRIDEEALGFSLDTLAAALQAEGLPEVWHGAFDPLAELSFFAEGRWRTWAVGHPDPERLAQNYARPYPGAERIYRHAGMSLGRDVLWTDRAVEATAEALARLCDHAAGLAQWERIHSRETT